jgi:putative intracellular protease/amidase
MILMVLTGVGQMPDGEPTGLWLEEFAVPYQLFVDAGYEVVLATPEGGPVPVDPRSTTGETMPANGAFALTLLQDTRPLRSVDLTAYDAVFFPGGHGTMFDLPNHPDVAATVAAFLPSGRPTALVCHGPAALVGVVDDAGVPLVRGRTLTAFSDSEERAVALDQAMPFLLETRLRELGAIVTPGPDFQAKVVVDGNLITGQNPPSSEGAAQAVLKLLGGAGE